MVAVFFYCAFFYSAVSQYHDKANIDELDAYAREAAETMAVGKDEWDKME